MRTVILGDPPFEIERALKTREALGQDLFDEVWEGEHHVVPAPGKRHARVEIQLALILAPLARRAGLEVAGQTNIGSGPNDYRVPDQSYFLPGPDQVFNPTAEIVVEIVSPGDESRQKFGFYFAHGIEEMLIVDPEQRSVEWFARGEAGFRAADGSALLGISAVELHERIDWPQ